MKSPKYNVPTLYVAYNRSDAVEQSWAVISRIRPSHLIIATDGPKSDRLGDYEKCAKVRGILEVIDWQCTVTRLYADVNMGCRGRMVSAITKAFEMYDRLVVIEDDVLLSDDFFVYAEYTLKRYENDERIHSITAYSPPGCNEHINETYGFSRYFHPWGWAAWRRSWSDYDENLTSWEKVYDEKWLRKFFKNNDREASYWANILSDEKYGRTKQTWDYQFQYAGWTSGRMNIVPRVNLVRNIGFGPDATHTVNANHLAARLEHATLPVPITSPSRVELSVDIDRRRTHKQSSSISLRIRRRILRACGALFRDR